MFTCACRQLQSLVQRLSRRMPVIQHSVLASSMQQRKHKDLAQDERHPWAFQPRITSVPAPTVPRQTFQTLVVSLDNENLHAQLPPLYKRASAAAAEATSTGALGCCRVGASACGGCAARARGNDTSTPHHCLKAAQRCAPSAHLLETPSRADAPPAPRPCAPHSTAPHSTAPHS